MMVRTQLRAGIAHVGEALRDPEAFAVRYNNGKVRYEWWVWASLVMTAIVGTTTYGMTMGILGGAADVFYKGIACTLSAGLAWAIPLPALYILNSLAGSRLSAGSTLLATLVTVSWGGLAMLASLPINWFLTAAIPHEGFVLLLNLIVFAGVGVAMIDVFQRVMRAIEPEREVTPSSWLLLVGTIGAELFYSTGLFDFTGSL
jgi:hypothetical protein